MTPTKRSLATLTIMALPITGVSYAAVESDQGGMVPSAIREDKSATPREYSVPPVNPKSLKPAQNHPFANKTVKNPKGENLGVIEHVLVDTVDGKAQYGELILEGNKQHIHIPINYLKESQTGLTLNATKEQLQKSGTNFGGQGHSQDFEHQGGEPLNPATRQGGS